MARPGTEIRDEWTESQIRNDKDIQRRREGRTEASGPDMWVDDQPTSADPGRAS